jgi:alpha-galactosidase
MLCASGGGRSDLDTLQWFHELWTSDDTDPVDRVRIQWGASHLLPASVLAAHVTRWGAKPFAFACAVALSGRFGFDVDLTALTDDERAVARDAVATAHRIRDVVEQGDLHRLVSPVGSDRAALAHVSRDGDRAIVFLHRLADGDHEGQPDPAIEVPGLGPVEGLHVVDLTPGRAAAGDGVDAANGTDALVDGLAWPIGPAPCSAVYEVTRRR